MKDPARLQTLGVQIAHLYAEDKYSLREVARMVGFTVRMVERYLDGMGVPRRDAEEAKHLARALRKDSDRCAWPACVQTRTRTSSGAIAALCYTHLKVALGLIHPGA